MMENILERIKNGQIKGMISSGCCFLKIQFIVSLPSFVANFKILNRVVPPEKSVTNFSYALHMSEGWKKRK